jgi:glycerophosphoryl diester phosphodiesterase
MDCRGTAVAALIIAHRGGAPGFAENTAAAFEVGIASGADMLETDVLCTADRHLVARHDQLVALPAGGQRRVSEMPLALLREAVPSIMLFEEFLERFASRILTNIDVKAPGFEDDLVRLLRRYDVTDNVLISATLARSLRRIKLLAPEMSTGLSRGQIVPWLGRAPHSTIAAELMRPTLPVQLLAHGGYALVNSFMLNHRLIRPWLVRFLHQRGYRVYCWTVNDPETALGLDAMGVDGIATDQPARIHEALRGSPERVA